MTDYQMSRADPNFFFSNDGKNMTLEDSRSIHAIDFFTESYNAVQKGNLTEAAYDFGKGLHCLDDMNTHSRSEYSILGIHSHGIDADDPNANYVGHKTATDMKESTIQVFENVTQKGSNAIDFTQAFINMIESYPNMYDYFSPDPVVDVDYPGISEEDTGGVNDNDYGWF